MDVWKHGYHYRYLRRVEWGFRRAADIIFLCMTPLSTTSTATWVDDEDEDANGNTGAGNDRREMSYGPSPDSLCASARGVAGVNLVGAD